MQFPGSTPVLVIAVLSHDGAERPARIGPCDRVALGTPRSCTARRTGRRCASARPHAIISRALHGRGVEVSEEGPRPQVGIVHEVRRPGENSGTRSTGPSPVNAKSCRRGNRASVQYRIMKIGQRVCTRTHGSTGHEQSPTATPCHPDQAAHGRAGQKCVILPRPVIVMMLSRPAAADGSSQLPSDPSRVDAHVALGRVSGDLLVPLLGVQLAHSRDLRRARNHVDRVLVHALQALPVGSARMYRSAFQ